ncbi:UNVERIFIED_CONTAM: Methylase involved in ubiquinone/menaquinone biosynthesis [Acetivibrio alkalicellulosi]
MGLSRNTTNIINWCLDNLLPPFIRDNKIIMGFLMRIIIGKKYNYYMEFKENLANLSEEEIHNYYNILQDTFISRETDLNKQTIEFILKNVLGNSILDVGCGKGFLAKLIASKKNVNVTALDIAVEESENKNDNPLFIKGKVEKLPFEDKSFDTVISTHNLEHIKSIHQALKELRRVTKGLLIIVVPRQREYKYTFDLHIHFFPYVFSFEKIVNNPKGKCICLKNDIVYMEKIDTRVK